MDNKKMIEEIKRLKEKKNAVILAHYYQCDEIQELADHVGDSLALSQVAASTNADIIVFCGVHFMAETAKILSPEKKVLLPVKEAGCPMADMVTAKGVEEYKQKNPNAKVICYVNSTAEVKALSDVCVTSTNAKQIAENYVGEQLLYVPDQNLGQYLNEQIPGLDMDLWPGHCCIHNNLRVSEVEKMKAEHPNAKFLVHPEANPAVVKMGDYVGSTQGILNYSKNNDDQEYIVGTERGIIYQMKKANPEKNFYLLSERLTCRTMKMTKLEDLYDALVNETNEIIVPEEVSKSARIALDKMLELS